MYFHVFRIDASGELCLRSALIVYGKYMYSSPMFCGNCKPWSELIDYHVCIIEAQQIDIIKQMELAFTYSILDPIDMRERVLPSSKANKRRMSLAYDDINKLPDLQIWHLEASFGNVIAVTSSSLDVFDHLSIFEGFGKHHHAKNMKQS